MRYKRIGQVQTRIVEGYLASVVNVADERKTIVGHNNNGCMGIFQFSTYNDFLFCKSFYSPLIIATQTFIHYRYALSLSHRIVVCFYRYAPEDLCEVCGFSLDSERSSPPTENH